MGKQKLFHPKGRNTMHSIVYYHEDGIVDICKTSELKRVKGNIMACYKDNYWYRASCIFKTPSLHMAENIIRQMYYGEVMLQKCFPPVNFTNFSTLPDIFQTAGYFSPILYKFAKVKFEDSDNETHMNSAHEMPVEIKNNSEEESSNKGFRVIESLTITREGSCEDVTVSMLGDELPSSPALDRNNNNEGSSTEYFEDANVFILGDKVPSNLVLTDNIIVEDVTPAYSKVTKREFCIFCMNLKSNISRHFITVHKEEEDVKKFLYFPNKNPERVKLIEELRKKGQVAFNTRAEINHGKFISVSRKNVEQHDVSHYRVCPSCKGYYSKTSIRRHIRLCAPQYIGERCTGPLGRMVEAKIHHTACDVLKTKIFPYMRNDTITHSICYDHLAVASANTWCKKYKIEKDFPMIRSRLRLLGRFLIAIRSVSAHVKQLKDIFQPKLYQQVVIAINNVAKFNKKKTSYFAPGSAQGLGGLLKKVGEIYKILLISDNNKLEIENLNNFMTVFNHEISNDVNRTVRENAFEIKRRKKIVLPDVDDIKKLRDYLHLNIGKYAKNFKENSTLFNYTQLASHLLIDLQVYNRRRAGEIERLSIGDFLAQTPEPDSEDYIIIELRGKLMRTVPLLISHRNNDCLKMLIESRHKFNITKDNPFVFALPSADERYKHLRACALLRQYSVECGSSRPELLRGTLLRKQVATYASQKEFSDSQVQNLADHLGHETKIFREIYSQPIIKKQLLLSTFLEEVQGNNQSNSNDQHLSEEEMECSSSSVETPPVRSSKKMKLMTNDNPNKRIRVSKNDSEMTPSSNFKTPDMPIGNLGRHSWSSEEKDIVAKVFSKNIESKTSPSMLELCEARAENEKLKCVNESQILGCVNNIIAKKKKESDWRNKTKVPHNRWNDEEIKVMKDNFGHFIEGKYLPSEIQCADLIRRNPTLSKRTPVMLKAWVNNYIRRESKKQLNTTNCGIFNV